MTISRLPPAAAASAVAPCLKNGRANAAMINARAAARISSRYQCRMRLRRTDWYGMRRTNISDGNATTCFRSRWTRCTRTGTAIAPRPRKKSGARKNMRIRRPESPHPDELLAARQIAEERAVERLGRVDQGVIDALLGEPGGERVDMILDHRAVLITERLRHDRHLLGGLQILEGRRLVVREIDLPGIQDVEHDELVAQKPERLDGLENLVRLVVEIRDEEQDASPLEVLRHLLQRLAEAARALGPGAIQGEQHHVEVL